MKLSLDIDRFMMRAKGADLFAGGSINRKSSTLSRYDAFLKKEGLEPGLDSLNRWLDELIGKLAPTSVHSYFQDVLTYFDVMVMPQDQEVLKLIRKRLPKIPWPEPDYLTSKELEDFMAGCSPRDWLLFAILYEYARRPGEVVETAVSSGLLWEDIDFEKDTIKFHILKKKAGRPAGARFKAASNTNKATYNLESYIKEALLEHKKRGLPSQRKVFKIKVRAVEYAFSRACTRAGIEADSKYGTVAGLVGRQLSPKILRHSRVTHLRAEEGVPIEVISKKLVRHSNYETTRRFYRAITEEESNIPSGAKYIKKKG